MTASSLRYKALRYVALNATNPERSVDFHERFTGLARAGLDLPNTRSPRLLRSRSSHCDLALYPHTEPGLRRVSFEMESARDLDAAYEVLHRAGLKILPVAPGDLRLFDQESAFRFEEPYSSLQVELCVCRAGNRTVGAPAPDAGGIQLGHVVVSVIDMPRTVEFFVATMNFRVSDTVDGAAVFLRCFPNPLHHSLAVGPAPENRLHHVNFIVDHMDDVGRAFHRFQKSGVPIVFGPGRHVPSDSMFIYFLDPDGLTFELSTGMEEFAEHGARAPRTLPSHLDSIDYWGSPIDPRFAAKGIFFADFSE